MRFDEVIRRLTGPLDAEAHAVEVATLKRCRSLRDLEQIAADGGWLTPGTADPRLKLVRHGSGAFLIVSYEDGWSSTVSRTA